MNKYIMLANYTEQGIKGFKEAAQRVDAGRALARQFGGEVKDVYLTMGAFDIVLVTEFPDAESAAKFAIKVGQRGNLRTTTLQAFSEEQYVNIAATLP